MQPARISKRTKFRDLPDWFMGRYFFFTLPYGLFYIIGAGVGYSRSGNLFCLLGSGGIGIIFTLMAIAHTIDYYRGARIESWFVGIPFTVSIFVAILMTCIWALGGRFKSSAIVACAAWVAVVIYFYAILKDYGGGSQVRENTWYSPLATHARDPRDASRDGGGLGLGLGGGRNRGQPSAAVSAENRAL